MNPSQAIEKARQEMERSFKDDGTPASFRRYVWQPPKRAGTATLPVQDDPWEVHGYGPSDNRPYYVVTLSGQKVNGLVKAENSVELFNRPDYARATIWDRISLNSETPSSK